MPGVNFILNLNGNLADRKPSFLQATQSLIIFDDYQTNVLLENKAYIFSSVGYKRYPVKSFDDGQFHFIIDGKIYDKDEKRFRQELSSLSDFLFSNDSQANRKLADWLLSTDGEFVIFIVHKPTGRVVVFNDVFCRLPLYFYQSGSEIIISRNFTFMADMIKDKQFDKMAVAQVLLFNYSFSRRTLLKNVERVEPASLIKIDMNNSTVIREVVYRHNFENKEHKDKSVRKNGKRLAELFCKACRDRFEPDAKIALSLSGGLDSRAIAAAFRKENIPFEAITWLDSRKAARLDVDIAGQVAELLNVKWNMFELMPARGADVLTILRTKGGQVNLRTAHLVQHHNNILRLYGPDVIYFAGNGGDRITGDLRPAHKINGIDEAFDHIMRKERQLSGRGDLSIENVAAITGIAAAEIIKEIKKEIADCPENDLAQKIVHFIIHGQSFKRYNEGEERERSRFWTCTPYWSVHFFRYIYNCPDAQKKGWQLYAEMLRQMNEPLCKINRAVNFRREGVPICTDSTTAFYAQLARVARRLLRPDRIAVKWTKKFFCKPHVPPKPAAFEHSVDFIGCLEEQITNCPAVGTWLSASAVRDVLNNSQMYNNEALGLLLTVTSAIEYLTTGLSTIEKHQQANLDSYA